MGVNSGISKEWKVDTEVGREHVRTKVVHQSGLIASFDAAVKKSYKGDGIWHDLSGKDNHILLTNVSHTSDKRGGLSFASGSIGTSIKPFTDKLTDGYTISAWIKHTGVVSTARTQRYVTIGTEVASIRHATSTAASLQAYAYNTASAIYSIDVANQILTDTYYHIAYSYNRNSGSNNLNLYKNSVLLQSATLVGTLRDNTDITLSSSPEYFEGNIYAMSIYNRALTQQEIKKNYLSTYDRFF